MFTYVHITKVTYGSYTALYFIIHDNNVKITREATEASKDNKDVG